MNTKNASIPIVVEMQNIVKKFGDFTANDGINLQVRKGEIYAILGENGAGKTTLMNILYGLYKPTSGKIFINGKEVHLDGSKKAVECGIGMVHQHFMLVQPFTVTENIVLGTEPKKNGIFLDMKTAREEVIRLSKRYQMDIDPDAKIEDISVGMQQRVEILKVLLRKADILILDEPTASLTPQEIKELIEIMHKLTEDGKSIILITHKLKEIKEAASRCTIIRQGKYIDTVDVENVSESELASLMVGRNVSLNVTKKGEPQKDVILKITDLYVKDYRGIDAIKGFNLELHKGEIVGLAGIDGNGQTELVECLTGLRKAEKGKITINGIDVFNASPRFIFESGITSIPQDRQKHGLVLDFKVEDNLVLQNYRTKKFSSHHFLNRKAISSYADTAIEKYDIRPHDCKEKKAETLSGGNQQKVIIAREIDNNKDVLIAVNPTRGLDVGAIEYIHRYIVGERNKGKAVLLVSFELDEIMSLSDRIAVIYNGNITGVIQGKDANENTLGLMMGGGKHNG